MRRIRADAMVMGFHHLGTVREVEDRRFFRAIGGGEECPFGMDRRG